MSKAKVLNFCAQQRRIQDLAKFRRKLHENWIGGGASKIVLCRSATAQ